MGGYDWEFTFDPNDLLIVRAILAAARRRARQLNVAGWRSRVDANSHCCYVVIDGPWVLLDLFVARLERDLPTICEAVSGSKRGPASRRGLGWAFVQIAARRRLGIDDHRQVGWKPHLRSRSQPPWSLAPHLLESPNAPDLADRLVATERMLVDWQFDEVAPEVMIEELHTAFELCLGRVLYGRYRRDRSFQQLVDKAASEGHFDQAPLRQFMPGYDEWMQRVRQELPSPGSFACELLITLKDARKVARHQGQNSAQAWLHEWVWPAATLLEDLAERAWTRNDLD